jgi:hypothetical protein
MLPNPSKCHIRPKIKKSRIFIIKLQPWQFRWQRWQFRYLARSGTWHDLVPGTTWQIWYLARSVQAYIYIYPHIYIYVYIYPYIYISTYISTYIISTYISTYIHVYISLGGKRPTLSVPHPTPGGPRWGAGRQGLGHVGLAEWNAGRRPQALAAGQ